MTDASVAAPTDLEGIASDLMDYILSQHPTSYSKETLPRDESLLELEILDSAGVIEFIIYAESHWDIEISDEDITKERMGSLNKMARLVHELMETKA